MMMDLGWSLSMAESLVGIVHSSNISLQQSDLKAPVFSGVLI